MFAMRKKPPSHVRTNSTDSLSVLSELSSSRTFINEDQLSPRWEEDMANSQSAPHVTDELRRYNGALLAALRAERKRSHVLMQLLKLRDAPDAASDDAEAPGSLTRGISAEEELIRSLSEMTTSNGRPASAMARLRGTRRRFSSAGDENAQPLAATQLPLAARMRKQPRRSRVVVDPLGAPLRAGSIVAAHDEHFAAAAAPAEEEPVAPAEATSMDWPEPAASPPCRRSKLQLTAQAAEGAARPGAAPSLSSGLASQLQRSVSDELQRLQERLQDVITSSPPADSAAYAEQITSLTRRLGWLRSDIATLQSHEVAPSPAEGSQSAPAADASNEDGSEGFASLFELASAAEEFAVSLRSELRSQARADAEREHANRLCEEAGLRVHHIDHDGDCLFACAYRWLETRKRQANAVPDVSDEAADATGDESVAESVAAMCGSASDVRALVIDLMRERSCGEASTASGELDFELVRRMEAAVAEAARSDATDGTSMAMRAGLLNRGVSFDVAGESEDNLAEAVAQSRRQASLEVYLEVMGQDGVYGERLEIEALAGLLGAPIHVYYFAGTAEAEAEATTRALSNAPSEVVAPPGIDEAAEPLRLLHLVHARHFSWMEMETQPADGDAD